MKMSLSDFEDMIDKHYDGNNALYTFIRLRNAIPPGAKKQALKILKKAWQKTEPLSAARQKIWRIREHISRIG